MAMVLMDSMSHRAKLFCDRLNHCLYLAIFDYQITICLLGDGSNRC